MTPDQNTDGAYKPVPADPLWAIFTPEVLDRLSRIRRPSPDLTFRLSVLAAGGLASHNSRGRALRARKSAWERVFRCLVSRRRAQTPSVVSAGGPPRAPLGASDQAPRRRRKRRCEGTAAPYHRGILLGRR